MRKQRINIRCCCNMPAVIKIVKACFGRSVPVKKLTGFAALILSSIISWTGAGQAAQESFEINLKELRPAPAGTSKTQQRSVHRPEITKAQSTTETGKAEGSSSYTVRPGDHLFVILMRHYHLSNQAAERLIPEVMRMNAIHNPHGLTVGQRLTIPLPPPSERQTITTRKQLPKAEPATAQAVQPQPLAPAPAAQIQSVTPQPVQTHPTTPAAVPEVKVSAAPPCILAHEILKQLDLIVPSTKLISGGTALTAEHTGLKVVVACGFSSDQAYTYDRLLAQHNMQLLAFTGTESTKQVVRKLANHLSLSYQQIDPDATVNQPLTYLFPAIGPNGRDIRLTIVP